jgi:hypothetical protein
MALRISNLARYSSARYAVRGSIAPTVENVIASPLSSSAPSPSVYKHTTAVQVALFSSSSDAGGSGSSSYSPIEWYRKRNERKEEEKYIERIAFMAGKPTWTIGDMLSELDEVVQSWIAKMPILSDNKETNMAKRMHKSVKGIGKIMGLDATATKLESMSRTEKLKAALEGETTAEQINILIQQFQTMDMMHRVLRKRVDDGKPLPQTAEAMQAAVQSEGSKLLSPKQKTKMMDAQQKKMKKQMRGRR